MRKGKGSVPVDRESSWPVCPPVGSSLGHLHMKGRERASDRAEGTRPGLSGRDTSAMDEGTEQNRKNRGIVSGFRGNYPRVMMCLGSIECVLHLFGGDLVLSLAKDKTSRDSNNDRKTEVKS
jgi:hypothetical protein